MRHPFTFSSDEVAELTEYLGASSAAAIPRLQIAIRHHLRIRWPADNNSSDQVSSAELARALQLAVRRIDDAASTIQKMQSGPDTILGMMDRGGDGRGSIIQRFASFRREAAELVRRLRLGTNKKGRPVDRVARDLATVVAAVLSLCGVVVFVSKTGTYGEVLCRVLYHVYDRTLESDSMIPLVKHGAHFVKGVPHRLTELLEVSARLHISLDDAVWALPLVPPPV